MQAGFGIEQPVNDSASAPVHSASARAEGDFETIFIKRSNPIK